MQNRHSFGGVSQISNDNQYTYSKSKTNIPSLFDTKPKGRNTSSVIHNNNKKNRDLDKNDTLNNIVEYSDSLSMSNSLDHVKKIKNESIMKNKDNSKFNLDIINENEDIKDKDKNTNYLKQVKDNHDDYEVSHIYSDTFTNVNVSTNENKIDQSIKFKNQSFANTNKNPIHKTGKTINDKVLTFGFKVDLKNENKLQKKIKNNYIHDQASVAEIIKFDDGNTLKRSKSTNINQKNKTISKPYNSEAKGSGGVDTELVKEI